VLRNDEAVAFADGGVNGPGILGSIGVPHKYEVNFLK
jgi:hypothetical protein